jgi:amino acid adenylation domain-containing protein
MLGVLKADCVYVPIDVTSPAARLERIVRSADPRLVLAASPAVPVLDELCGMDGLGEALRVASVERAPIECEHVRSELARSDWEALSGEPLDWASSTHDAAHILFTSGSTGVPKGVVITHANVIHFVEWACGYFGTRPGDRISGHPPLYFDLSTFDIYGTMAAGAQLHLVPPELSLLPHKLADFIRRAELTQWFSVPSILTYMAKFDVVRFGDFRSLERLLWCGEAIPTPTLRYWMERLPNVTFTNLYGPTEATIASSYFTVRERPASERESIPIGTACPGEELLVLDEAMRPVPPGVIGDLYIAGAGLSPGYWRDDEKTRAAFRPDPRSAGATARLYRTGDLARVGADGLTYFVGRSDTQIKSRGYRIELGEIEAALGAVDAVRESAVVGVPAGGLEGTAICCAFAPCENASVDRQWLRGELSRVLPSYMLPSRWLVLDSLPRNANGKIDRRKLRELFESGADNA